MSHENASENSTENKNIFKVDDKKDLRTVSVDVIRVSFDQLGTYFYMCDGIYFNKASRLSCDGVCFSVLVKHQALLINGSDGVYNRACFYLHAVFVYKKSD